MSTTERSYPIPTKPDVVVVTPEMAEDWLAHAKFVNRKLRLTKVQAYAADMAAGDWKLNGDALVWNGNKSLINGHHRLNACILAGVPFTTLVMPDAPTGAFETIDTGMPRTLADVLRWSGESDPALLAAVINICWAFDHGRLRDPRGATRTQQLAWLDVNQSVRESVVTGRRTKDHVPTIMGSVLGACHYLTARVDRADADVFMERLSVGADLGAEDPILLLRNWAFNAQNRRDKPPRVAQMAYTIKAMNTWRQGRTLRSLHWRSGGAAAEEFPTVWEP